MKAQFPNGKLNVAFVKWVNDHYVTFYKQVWAMDYRTTAQCGTALRQARIDLESATFPAALEVRNQNEVRKLTRARLQGMIRLCDVRLGRKPQDSHLPEVVWMKARAEAALWK